MAEPYDNSDVDFNAVAREDKTAAPTLPDSNGNPDFTKLKDDANFQTPRFDLRAQFDLLIEPTVKDFNKHYSNGAKALHNGYTYNSWITGQKSLAQAKAEVQAADEAPDLTPWGSTLGFFAESAPALSDMAASYAQGFAASIPAGVAGGVILAGPTAEAAAPITIPGAVLATGNTVGAAAVLTVNSEVAAGNIAQELLDAGVPEDKARAFAISGGLVVGLAQRFGVGVWAKQVLKATATGGTPIVETWMRQYFKSAGIAIADVELQNLSITLAEAAGKYSAGIEEKDLLGKLVKGLAASIPQGLGLAGLGMAFKHVTTRKPSAKTEAAPEPIEPQVDHNSPAEIVQAMVEILQGKPVSGARQWGKVSLKDKIYDKIAEIKDAISDAEPERWETLTPEQQAHLDALKLDLADARAERKAMASEKKAADLKDMKATHKAAVELSTEKSVEHSQKLHEHQRRTAALEARKAKMADLDERISTLEDERSAFELEATADLKDSVQRIDEPGATPDFDKPQGIFTSRADVKSPHAELGGEVSIWDKNPNAKVLKVNGDTPVTTNRGHLSSGAGAGIQALPHLVGEVRAKELLAIRTKAELLPILKKEFPKVDWERYIREKGDAQDMLEGYAGMKAREAGYDAIEAKSKTPEFDEYVGLTSESMTRRGPASAPESLTKELAEAVAARRKLGKGIQAEKDAITKLRIEKDDAKGAFDRANLAAKTLKGKIDKIEKSALKVGVSNLLKQLEKAEPQGTGANKRSRFERSPNGENIQQTLKLYKNFLHDKAAAAQAVIDYATANDAMPQSADLLERHAVNEEVVALRGQAEIAQEVLGLSDGASYDALAAKIKGITEAGKKDRLTQLAEESAERKANRRISEDYADGNKPIRSGDGNTTEAEAKAAALHPIKQFLRDMGGTTANSKAYQIAQDHPNSEGFVDMMDPAPHINKVFDNIDAQTLKLFGHIKAATGLGDAEVLKLNHKLNTHEVTVGNKKFTLGEALAAVFRSRDPELRRGILKGNKLDGIAIQNLEDELARVAPEALKMLDGYKAFLGEYGPRLAAFFKADKGLELDVSNPDYSGPARRRRVGGKIEPEQDLVVSLNSAAKSRALTVSRTGSTIARVDSPLEIHLENPLLTIMRHIEATERYGGLNEISRQLYTPVLTNPELKTIVTAKNGPFAFNAYVTQIRDVLGKSEINNGDLSDRMNNLLRGAGSAHLGLNPLGYVKQATGVVNFLLEMPPEVLSAGYVDYFKDMKAHNTILMQSPILQRRYADFLRTQLGASTLKTLQDSKFDKVNDMLMLPLKLGDKAASMPGAWAAYKHFMSKEGGGFTHEVALEKAAMMVEHTQASGRPDIQSNFSRNAATKMFGMFSQPVQRQFDYEVQAWRKQINFPSPENWKKAVTASATVRASQALFVGVNAAYITALKQFGLKDKQDEDNAHWEVVRNAINPVGPLATLPIVGYVPNKVSIDIERHVSKALSGATGGAIPKSTNRAFPLSTLFWDASKATGALADDVAKISQEGLTVSNFAGLVTHYSDSLINLSAGGLPLARISKPVKDMADHNKIPRLQSSGSSGDNSSYFKR